MRVNGESSGPLQVTGSMNWQELVASETPNVLEDANRDGTYELAIYAITDTSPADGAVVGINDATLHTVEGPSGEVRKA